METGTSVENCHPVDIKEFAEYIGLSLLSKGISITPLKLQKMLYYNQAWHMVVFGRDNTLFEDVPEAWVNGPVYPVIHDEYKAYSIFSPLPCSAFGITDESGISDQVQDLSGKMGLSKNQIQLIDSVNTLYGTKRDEALVFLTHSELPWSEKRAGLLPFDKTHKPLSLDTMYSYYKERYDSNRARKQL